MDLNISSCRQTTRLASNYLNRSSICLSKLTHMDAIWSHVISISTWHRPTLCAIDDTSSMLLRLLSSVELSRSSYILLMFSHLICQNQCGLISHSIFLYLPIYLRKQLSINLNKKREEEKKTQPLSNFFNKICVKLSNEERSSLGIHETSCLNVSKSSLSWLSRSAMYFSVSSTSLNTEKEKNFITNSSKLI